MPSLFFSSHPLLPWRRSSNTHALASSFVPQVPSFFPFFSLSTYAPEHEKDTRFSSPRTPDSFHRTRPNGPYMWEEGSNPVVPLHFTSTSSSHFFLSDVAHEGYHVKGAACTLTWKNNVVHMF